MFCKECGNGISDRAVVCTKCGVATDNLEKKNVGGMSIGALVAGYVLAFTMPLIGGIVGLYALVKGKHGHGIAMLALALFSFFFWVGVLEGMGM